MNTNFLNYKNNLINSIYEFFKNNDCDFYDYELINDCNNYIELENSVYEIAITNLHIFDFLDFLINLEIFKNEQIKIDRLKFLSFIIYKNDNYNFNNDINIYYVKNCISEFSKYNEEI